VFLEEKLEGFEANWSGTLDLAGLVPLLPLSKEFEDLAARYLL
jgi:hypothetical protein